MTVFRPVLPTLGFSPISSLFPPVSSFHPFLLPAPPAVASSSSSFSVSSLVSPPVSSTMPSFPVPSVSALPHLFSLGCSFLSSFASVASWSSPLVASSSLAPISSFPWPVVLHVTSVPPFPTPPVTFPVSSLFAPAPVPSTVASSSSSSSCSFCRPGSLGWRFVVSSLVGPRGWVAGVHLSFTAVAVADPYLAGVDG